MNYYSFTRVETSFTYYQEIKSCQDRVCSLFCVQKDKFNSKQSARLKMCGCQKQRPQCSDKHLNGVRIITLWFRFPRLAWQDFNYEYPRTAFEHFIPLISCQRNTLPFISQEKYYIVIILHASSFQKCSVLKLIAPNSENSM